MTNLFIWDFHGVLEKDNEYAVQEVVNRVLPEFDIIRKATVEECRALYGKKWADYYKFYNPEADEETINSMVNRAVEISVGEKIASKHIKPMDHAKEVLETIAQKGHVNLLMSNSSPEALDYFLEAVGLQDSFDYKFAADRHRKDYAKNTKEEYLIGFFSIELLTHGPDYDKIILIDDSETGIEMGLKIGAVTYHFSRNGNPCKKAHYSISDLREVLREA